MQITYSRHETKQQGTNSLHSTLTTVRTSRHRPGLHLLDRD